MGKPDFLIIGAARSGTTALASFLQQHPEAFICAPKEPHFFAFADQQPNFCGPGDDVMLNRRAVTQWSEYEQLYQTRRDERVAGEGSVSTLYYHPRAIENIRRYAPDVKLIAVLRNPIDRAFSSYLYMVGRGFEPLDDFAAALAAEQQRCHEGWHHIWHYTSMGFYAAQIEAFQHAFGRERLKVYLFDDLRNSEQDLLQDLFSFLGIDSQFRPQTDISVNRSGVPKSQLLTAAMQQLSRFPRVRECVKSVVPFRIRERIRAANLSRPKLADDIRDSLRDIFQQDIQQLSRLLERDLSPWLATSDESGLVEQK